MWTQSRLRLAFAPSLDLIPCLQDSKWANFKAVCWTLLYWSLQFYTMEPCSTFHQYSSDIDLVELAFFCPLRQISWSFSLSAGFKQCGANFRSFSDSWYGGASTLHSIPGQSNELLAQKYDGIIYILLRPSSAVANWADDAILTFLQCRFIPCAGQKCRQSIANLSKFTILTLLPELTTSPLILDRPHTSWL